MIMHINGYADARGRSLGRLLSLSPSLHISLDHATNPRRFAGYRLQAICETCGYQIERHPIAINDRSGHGLRCKCIEILFRDPPFTESQIIKLWAELRKIKSRAESRLAPAEAN